MQEGNGSDKGLNGWILDEELMNPLALALVREILENSCLRLGRRNEEETKQHCLSKCVSLPTSVIILSMMSCGISTDFAICATGMVYREI